MAGTCAECGGVDIDPRSPCQHPPMIGAAVCRSHGGGAPQVAAGAAARLEDGDARRYLERVTLSAEPVRNPLEALQAGAGKLKAMIGLLEERVAELSQWTSRTHLGDEAVRVELRLWLDLMAEQRAWLATCARTDIDQRLATIDEIVGTQIVQLLGDSLAELNLGAAVEAKAREVVGRRLAALAEAK